MNRLLEWADRYPGRAFLLNVGLLVGINLLPVHWHVSTAMILALITFELLVIMRQRRCVRRQLEHLEDRDGTEALNYLSRYQIKEEHE